MWPSWRAGVGWVPYMMDRLDRSYDIWAGRGVAEFSDWVKKRPSEYITNGNVYFSAEGDEEGIAYAIKRLGPDAVLYASDFPHETNAKRAIHEIDELLERESELPDGTIQKILSDNVTGSMARDPLLRRWGAKLAPPDDDSFEQRGRLKEERLWQQRAACELSMVTDTFSKMCALSPAISRPNGTTMSPPAHGRLPRPGSHAQRARAQSAGAFEDPSTAGPVSIRGRTGSGSSGVVSHDGAGLWKDDRY